MKRWKVRMPYLWTDGSKKFLRFQVEAKNRDSARITALMIADKRLPTPPNVNEMKMTRVYA